MLMVVNFEESAKKIYHRQNCEIALEIPFCNRFEMETKKAIKLGYSMCPCCGGLKGEMRLRESQLESLEKKYDFSLTYVEDKDRLYIKTETGFWMVLFQRDMAKYLLFHRNEYSSDLTFEELTEGPYHRQYDRNPTESLEKIMCYVSNHDKAKGIIADDYKKLPQDTKKQKKYYKAAEKKSKGRQIRRVDSIFLMLEMQDPALKKVSIY